jgi:hypothetical protein
MDIGGYTRKLVHSKPGCSTPRSSSGYLVDLFWQNKRNRTRKQKVRISILPDLDVLNFFKERVSKAGSLAYQYRSIKLRSHMEGKELVDAKTLAQADRFIRTVAKRVEELSSRQRKSA